MKNDAVFIMDKVLVPWRTCSFTAISRRRTTSFRAPDSCPVRVHGCTRLAVKLISLRACCSRHRGPGTKDYRGVQANVGEVIAWRNLFWGFSDAMVRDPKPWIGDFVLPNMIPANRYQRS